MERIKQENAMIVFYSRIEIAIRLYTMLNTAAIRLVIVPYPDTKENNQIAKNIEDALIMNLPLFSLCSHS